jgi:hypothetical protein
MPNAILVVVVVMILAVMVWRSMFGILYRRQILKENGCASPKLW